MELHHQPLQQELVSKAVKLFVRGPYGQAGMAGLSRPQGWRRGRRGVAGKRLRLIERLKREGKSNRAIAQRLGVSEMAIRKLLGPSKQEEKEQLTWVPASSAPVPGAPAGATLVRACRFGHRPCSE